MRDENCQMVYPSYEHQIFICYLLIKNRFSKENTKENSFFFKFQMIFRDNNQQNGIRFFEVESNKMRLDIISRNERGFFLPDTWCAISFATNLT